MQSFLLKASKSRDGSVGTPRAYMMSGAALAPAAIKLSSYFCGRAHVGIYREAPRLLRLESLLSLVGGESSYLWTRRLCDSVVGAAWWAENDRASRW